MNMQKDPDDAKNRMEDNDNKVSSGGETDSVLTEIISNKRVSEDLREALRKLIDHAPGQAVCPEILVQVREQHSREDDYTEKTLTAKADAIRSESRLPQVLQEAVDRLPPIQKAMPLGMGIVAQVRPTLEELLEVVRNQNIIKVQLAAPYHYLIDKELEDSADQ